jgi:hypothetical protein
MSETLAGIGSDNLLAALPPEIGELTNLTELRGTTFYCLKNEIYRSHGLRGVICNNCSSCCTAKHQYVELCTPRVTG